MSPESSQTIAHKRHQSDSPLVSVIIPVFNGSAHIFQTVSSVARQSLKDLEVIVVDDGSTDDTLREAGRAAEQFFDTRLTIVHQDNRGVSAARNCGLSEASGRHVIFLDADDLLDENLIASLESIDEAHTADVVFWQYAIVQRGNSSISKLARNPPQGRSCTGTEALRALVIDNEISIWTGSAAYRRDWLRSNNLTYTPGCRSGEDREFIIKALANAGDVVFIAELLSYYVVTGGSATQRYSLTRFDAVPALIRTADYLHGTGDPRLTQLAERLSTTTVIEHYFYHFAANVLASRKSARSLVHSLGVDYPGLTEGVLSLLTEKRGTLPFRHKLFLLSPTIYEIYLRASHIKSSISDRFARIQARHSPMGNAQ